MVSLPTRICVNRSQWVTTVSNFSGLGKSYMLLGLHKQLTVRKIFATFQVCVTQRSLEYDSKKYILKNDSYIIGIWLKKYILKNDSYIIVISLAEIDAYLVFGKMILFFNVLNADLGFILLLCEFYTPSLLYPRNVNGNHYTDVTMSLMASQITSLTIVYSTVYSGADQRKHQSPASLAFVQRIHRGPVNSPHKRPVTRKMFPFDDVIMYLLCVLGGVY